MTHYKGRALALLVLGITGCAASPAWREPQPAAAPVSRQLPVDSPTVRAIQARCGLAEAEVAEALRLANPRFGVLRLSGGGLRETTFSLSQELLDLMFTGFRRRQGEIATRQAMQQCAGALLQLETDIRLATIAHAAAVQALHATRREHEAALLSARFAARYREAGNISELAQRREEAVASETALALAREQARVAAARSELDTLLGRRTGEQGATYMTALPLFDEAPAEVGILQQRALDARLDLAALRAERELRATQARQVRRWGWLGGATLEAERETQRAGPSLAGGGVEVPVPLLDSGAPRRRVAAAWLALREAELAQLELRIANDVAALHTEVRARREAVATHARALIEQRARIVALTQQQADYMLVGSFELIAVRAQQFAAWRTYIESAAQLAQAQIRLAQALGEPPPAADAAATIDLETLP